MGAIPPEFWARTAPAIGHAQLSKNPLITYGDILFTNSEDMITQTDRQTNRQTERHTHTHTHTHAHVCIT